MNNNATLFPSYFNKKEFLKMNKPFGEGDLKFYPADDESRFLESLKTQPEDWYYRTKDITYKLNSHGYRTQEFNTIDWANSIVLFGCSCTFGIGVDEDETISYYLSQITNRPVINMGWPGGSNMSMLMNSSVLKQEYPTPYAVVFLWSTTDRFVMFTDLGIHNVGPWDMEENRKHLNEIYSHNTIYTKAFEGINYFSENETIHAHFTNEFAKYMWKDKTKYITGTFFGSTAEMIDVDLKFSIDNGARDLIHNGRNSNLKAANSLDYLIKNYGRKNLL
jgi:hypothetical protein